MNLYYLPPSPPCRAVLLLGRILGLDLNLKSVNIQEGEHLKKEFLDVSKLLWQSFCLFHLSFQLNPTHTIPTLEVRIQSVHDNQFLIAFDVW